MSLPEPNIPNSPDRPGNGPTGIVFDVQRMSIHDGPGIRTTVFLKGCPLRCLWCHNPEGISGNPQLAFTASLCIGCGACVEHCPTGAHTFHEGMHHIDRDRCEQCFACAAQCCAQALEVVGKPMSADEVLAEVLKDRLFYEESGGGMTLSGGEPLSQPRFAKAVLEAAKREGLHTCVETSGWVAAGHALDAAPFVDLFLFDFKESDASRHEQYTGRSNERILDTLRQLDAAGAETVLRCPIVPDLNLRDGHLHAIAALAQSLEHCREVQILGHHRMGEAKRARFAGLHAAQDGAPLRDMSTGETQSVAERVRAFGAPRVSVG